MVFIEVKEYKEGTAYIHSPSIFIAPSEIAWIQDSPANISTNVSLKSGDKFKVHDSAASIKKQVEKVLMAVSADADI